MNDELEPRLRNAFRTGSLPAAPASLVQALERVPDAPVTARRRRTGRSVWGPFAVAAVLAVGGAVVIGGGQRGITPGPTAPASSSPALTAVPTAAAGLLRVTYQVQTGVGGIQPTAGDMDGIAVVIRKRLTAGGFDSPAVRVDGDDGLVVDLPASIDTDAARRLIGQTGRLDFVPLGGDPKQEGDTIDPAEFPALFSGDEVESAAVKDDPDHGRIIEFVLKPEGAGLFEDYTTANIGKYFAIVLDGKVLTAPVINSAIPGGHVQIESGGIGGYPLEAARDLVAVINVGALRYPLAEISNEIVPAGASPSAR
jgi:hypothetical protein